MRGDFCKFKHKEYKQRNDNERSRTNDQKMKYTVPSCKGENENRCRYGSSCTRGNTCKFKHEQNQRNITMQDHYKNLNSTELEDIAKRVWALMLEEAQRK